MADNKDNKFDPYEELKGYFPENLDLTPEELEKEIEIEKKQSAIALGMTDIKDNEDGEEAELEADAVEETEAEIIPDTEPVIDEANEVVEEEDAWIPPVAQEVTDNELLNKYDSLDELLDELEAPEGDDDDGSQKLRERVNWVYDFLEVFTVCMACIILVFSFFARITKVDGPSMENTLHDGQYLIISDVAYTPKAGDIVVVQNTSLSDPRLTHPLVKRVIATAGQTVSVGEDGSVTITDTDGTVRELDQSYIKEEEYRKQPISCEVPEGYVFIMGDNRNNSADSRDPRIGLVDERCIFGRAVLRVFPFSDFTVFKNPYDN